MEEIKFNEKTYSLDKKGFVNYEDAKEIVKFLKIRIRSEYRCIIKKLNPKILPSNPNLYYAKLWISWGEYLSTALDTSGYLTYSELQSLIIELGIKSKVEYINWIKGKEEKYPSRPDIIYKKCGWISWRNFFDPSKPKFSYSYKKKDFPTYEELKNIVLNLGINTRDEYKNWVKENNNNYPSHPDNTYKNKGWISWGDFFNKRKTPSYEELKNIIKNLNIKTMDEYEVWARNNNYPVRPDKSFIKDWVSWSTFLSSDNLSSVEKNSLYVSYDEAKSIIQSQVGIINSFRDWKVLYKSNFEQDLRIPSNPQIVYRDKGWIDWYDWLGKDPYSSISSSGEFFLRENLKFINYEIQKTFDWLINKSNLYLDLYIPSLKIAIEVQGIQHFKPIEFFGGEEGLESTIERDELKFNLCKEHDITVLYYVHDNTIDIPQEFLDRHKYLRSLDELINEIKDFEYGT